MRVARCAAEGRMILRLDGVHKSFATGFRMRRVSVLNGVSLELAAGDAYGLLGANGAGKSTTLRVLLGLTRPDRGSGELLGAPLGDQRVRARLGYLPETPAFHDQLSALEFLTLCGSLFGLRSHDLCQRAIVWLERLELQHAADMRLRKMSKGMLQRLGLAQALLGDPELLVLDEPMSGLDPHGRKLVRDLILEQRAQGRTVLFSSHILSDVEIVCTRAGMLRDGVVVHEQRLDDLTAFAPQSVEVQARGLDDEMVARLGRGAHRVARHGVNVLFVVAPGRPAQDLVRAVLDAGGTLDGVVPRRVSLEEALVAVGVLTAAAEAMPASTALHRAHEPVAAVPTPGTNATANPKHERVKQE